MVDTEIPQDRGEVPEMILVRVGERDYVDFLKAPGPHDTVRSLLLQDPCLHALDAREIRERRHRNVIGRQRLLRDARAQAPQDEPAKHGRDRSSRQPLRGRRHNAANEQAQRQEEPIHQCGGCNSESRERRPKAERNTAAERRGDCDGRQLHGARLKRTSVSMWKVCGNRSNRCTSEIS
jgi:hypothetical protein